MILEGARHSTVSHILIQVYFCYFIRHPIWAKLPELDDFSSNYFRAGGVVAKIDGSSHKFEKRSVTKHGLGWVIILSYRIPITMCLDHSSVSDKKPFQGFALVPSFYSPSFIYFPSIFPIPPFIYYLPAHLSFTVTSI